MDNVGIGSIFGGGASAPGGAATAGNAATPKSGGILSTATNYGAFGTFPMQQMASIQAQKVEAQEIKLKTSMAKQQAASQALAASQNFRQSLSSQLATSALRSAGGGSIATQFATASMAAMFQDESNYNQQVKYLDLAQTIGLIDSKAKLRAQQIKAVSSLTQMATGGPLGSSAGSNPLMSLFGGK